MNSTVLTFLESIGSSAVVSTLVIWLLHRVIETRLKAAVEHKYEVKTADHLAKLRRENESILTRLNAELERTTQQRRVEYETLFKIREPMVKGLYENLLKAIELAEQGLGDLGKCQEAKNALARLYYEMEVAAIYFPKAFHESWCTKVLALRHALVEFSTALQMRMGNFNADDQILLQATTAALDILREIKGPLRDELRSLLGVATT
jgi:hypothetical protein